MGTFLMPIKPTMDCVLYQALILPACLEAILKPSFIPQSLLVTAHIVMKRWSGVTSPVVRNLANKWNYTGACQHDVSVDFQLP